MKHEFKRRTIAMLEQHRIMTIATNRPDGWPQATVVSYVNDGLIVYCVIGRDSQKYTNIVHDPRVSLAIANDYPQPLQIKGLSIAARADISTDPGEREHVQEILLRRFPEYKIMPPPDPAKLPLLRITPQIVSLLDYSQGFGHAELLQVTENDLAEFVEARRHHWASFHAA